MKARSILIAGFVLFSLFVFCIVLAKPFGQCDPVQSFRPAVDIQGAHIVSAGAYFRFWMFNYYPFPINVTINGADPQTIPSNNSINYDVIAPQISVPYEKVTYTFIFTTVNGASGWQPVDFTVLVLNSSFLQIFDLIGPILIVIAVVIIATATIFILRKRRSLRKT